MGLFDIFRRKREDEGTQEAVSDVAVGGARTGVQLYFADEASAAMRIAAVYRCVNILGDNVASLRMRYMVKRGDCFVEDSKSDFGYLLNVQPTDDMNAATFWKNLVSQVLLKGNAYVYPRKVAGEVVEFVLCSGAVSHDPLNRVYVVSDPYGGVAGTFTEEEMIHVFFHSSDGRTGESVLKSARKAVDITTAGDSETESRFRTSGAVRGIVSNGSVGVRGFGEYQDEQLAKTAEDVGEKFRSGANIVSLPGQVDFKQVSLSSSDMQFLETRKFSVREICRFFGVPPTFVFDDSSSNYKSAESANISFLTMTLNPILTAIEAEFNRKLLTRSQLRKAKFSFDRTGIYAMDMETKADYQLKTIQSGIYTINDWRKKENQPPVPGGDTVYISTNLSALGSEKLGATPNNEDTE